MTLGETTVDWVADRRAAARRRILDAAWEVAHDKGLAVLTLREVAHRVGIKPPSLYSHFESKNAIYDAMFGEAWTEFLEYDRAQSLPDSPRAALRAIARSYFDFATADLARHQLMSTRVIPGFTPSEASYAPAVTALKDFDTALAALRVELSASDIDVFTALIAGLVDQQWANDPGGSRWAELLDRTIDMFADDLGLPQEDA